MFCPQCGQQSTGEIRFCPRCGLSLVPHAAILASGDTTAGGSGLAPQVPVRSPRRVSTRRAAKLMFFSAVLFPIFFGIGIAADGPGPLLVPLTLFLAGLTWMIYARLFGDDSGHVIQPKSRSDLRAGREKPQLGARQFVPASLFDRQGANTAEIARPPSVTEHTTKLLDKDS
jgi:hypothetical protein